MIAHDHTASGRLLAGVDLGRTQRRLRLVDQHKQVLLDAALPFNAALTPIQQVAEMLTTVLPGTEHGCVDTLACGLTGLHGSPPDPAPLLEACSVNFGTSRVIVADDSVTSYLGAVGRRPAVVCAAGTGVVVLASDGTKCHTRVDGWGQFGGDLGGGLWVGRCGLAAAFKAADGRPGGAPRLLARLQAIHGEPGEFAHWASGHPIEAVPLVAEFAEQVFAAAREDDPIAREICNHAARHLAESIIAAHTKVRAGQTMCAAGTGKLFAAGDILVGPVRRHIESQDENAVWLTAVGSSLDGAVLLAAEPQPPTEFQTLIRIATVEARP